MRESPSVGWLSLTARTAASSHCHVSVGKYICIFFLYDLRSKWTLATSKERITSRTELVHFTIITSHGEFIWIAIKMNSQDFESEGTPFCDRNLLTRLRNKGLWEIFVKMILYCIQYKVYEQPSFSKLNSQSKLSHATLKQRFMGRTELTALWLKCTHTTIKY